MSDLPAVARQEVVVPERHLEPVRPLPAVPDDDSDDPQWVILGKQTPGGVLVLASSTLTEAQLKRGLMSGYDPGPLGAKLPRWSITLSCQMRDFVQVRGEDYPAAMRTLFELWSP